MKRSTPKPEDRRNGSSVFCAPLDRYIGRHIDRCIDRCIDRHATDMSVDISTDTRPIYRPRYVGRHIGRYIGRLSLGTRPICRSICRPRVVVCRGAGSPSHNAVRQSSREFSQMKTKVSRKSRSFAGFHLLATSILFVVVTSSLDLSSVHALRKM